MTKAKKVMKELSLCSLFLDLNAQRAHGEWLLLQLAAKQRDSSALHFQAEREREVHNGMAVVELQPDSDGERLQLEC